MTNINTSPNHIHLSGDTTTVGHYFGRLSCPVQASPLKYHPHIVAHFKGLRLELEPATAIEVARGIYEAVASLGTAAFPDIAGAAWTGVDE